METIINYAIELLATILVGLLSYLSYKVKVYIQSKLEEKNENELSNYISEFCEAAEQTIKNSDEKYNYVIELLEKIGYEITDYIKSKIEAKVYRINKENEE